MNVQLSLLEKQEVHISEDEGKTIVHLGRRNAAIPLKRLRRTTIKRLMEILTELEGNDIHIGWCGGSGGHFWLEALKLPRLRLSLFPWNSKPERDEIPNVIVLWGSRGAQVRIFTEYLVAVREQEYQGYWHYLLDFRNGFYDAKLDQWRSHYDCITITKFKE